MFFDKTTAMYQLPIPSLYRFPAQTQHHNIINAFNSHPHITMNTNTKIKRCSSASNHLDLYLQTKSIIHNGKFKSKMQQIREKYIGCIDKNRCVLRNYEKQKQNQQPGQETRLEQQINNGMQWNLNCQLRTEQKQNIFRRSAYSFQSPYNKLDQAETCPNTMRKNSPTHAEQTRNRRSSTTTKKRPYNKQVARDHMMISSKLQKKCLQKIKVRVLSAQITHLKMDKMNSCKWINKLQNLYEKQMKMRSEVKAKILLKLNILPNSQQ